MKNSLFLLTPLMVAITACHPFSDYREQTSRTQTIIDQHQEAVGQGSMRVGDARYDVRVSDGYWVATDLEVMDSALPERLVTERNDYILGDSRSLQDLSAYLTARTGIQIRRAPELIPKNEFVRNDLSLGFGDQIQPDMTQMQTSQSGQSGELSDYIHTPNYRMNLKRATFAEVLDQVAQAMGVSWSYSRRDGVLFYYYKTDTFVIAKTGDGGSAESQSTTASSTQTDDNASTTSLSTNLKIEPRFWENTRRVIEEMSSRHGRVLFNEATGAVTVTDNPIVVSAIRDYIEQLNKSLRLRATVHLMIARVKKSHGQDLNLNIDAVYQKAEQTLFQLQTQRITTGGLSGFSAEAINPTSAYNGSQIFLDALASEGEVSVLRSKNFVLRNHSLFSIAKGDVIRYLSSASTTNTSQVGSTESSEITDLFVGFGMSFYTRVINKNRVVFNIMLDQSDLNGFESIPISSELVSQVPQTSKEGVIQEYEMKSGESQVLLAFDLSSGKYDNASNLGCLFGCNRSGSREREYLLYIMTASLE